MVFPVLFNSNHVLTWIDLYYLCQDLLHNLWNPMQMKLQGPWLKREGFQDGTSTVLIQGQFLTELGALWDQTGYVSMELALILSPNLLLLCLSANEAHSLWVLFLVSEPFNKFTQATCIHHPFSCTVLL